VVRVLNNPDPGAFADPYSEYYQQALKLQSYSAQFRARYGIPGVYPPG
jgi:hypothetical protein